MAKRANSTPVMLDPIPLQFARPSSTWSTPVLPRNFFVTGYSPETLDLETPSPPARPTESAPNNEQPVKNPGPTVPLRIQEVVCEFTGGVRRRRMVAEIAATHDPDDEAPDDRTDLPPKKRPHYVQHVDLGTPPRSSSDLPPRAPPRTSSKNPPRAPVDPLLHTSIVTPPCPIQPEEDVTPLEERCYSHVSTIQLFSYVCISLVILSVLSCKTICT